MVLMIVAEALFPGYSVSGNHISDLGANCGSVCVINQPSASIFDASVFLLGLAGAVASYLIFASRFRLTGALAFIGSLGAMGVGVFPETTGGLHILVSFLAFFFTGIAALTTYRITGPPMTYFAAALGVFTIVALALYASGTFLGLGPGGMERMVAYPAVIWVIALGANLLGASRPTGP